MFCLRDYRLPDFEHLYRLDQQCFPPGIAYSRAELSSYVARKGSFTIVAEFVADETSSGEGSPAAAAKPTEVKPAIAGFITVEMHPKGYGHIITIDTRAEFRRQHLGSMLIEAAEKHVSDLGGFMTILEVAVNNVAAIAFYKRHRYVTVKTLPRYYNGELDALLLSRRL